VGSDRRVYTTLLLGTVGMLYIFHVAFIRALFVLRHDLRIGRIFVSFSLSRMSFGKWKKNEEANRAQSWMLCKHTELVFLFIVGDFCSDKNVRCPR
jgi:hypothetical protein